MRKILTIILMGLSVGLNAQCFNIPCSMEFSLPVQPNQVNNSNINDKCFVNYTCYVQTIHNSVNFNNWNYITIKAISGDVVVNQNVNFGSGTKKLYIYSDNNKKVTLDYVSFSGDDTIFVDGKLEIGTVVANNFNNTIFMRNFDSVKVGGTYYKSGDTLKTVLSNRSNDVIFRSCAGVVLPLVDYKFQAYNKGNVAYLRWDYRESLQVQYSYDGKNWKVAAAAHNNYEMKIDQNTLFKLVNGNDYSKVIPVRYIYSGKDVIYTLDGRLINEITVPGIYIINGIKVWSN